ncbi:SGNH/GDSL hydrolase family protein [Pseudaestuariivita atlantica]|uniref:SGNH hydrolase-type esterase domain-containing protein n=1 Tax=Pseudaestuariivita atlantica TaxID=1317121 RepID=A0A0L1JR46_9RHOB|nr:SGNH/GDSL hydrolase family protein [Pseudaestuariivita atlantica]KNG94210.1 hypothetical protein ATO11_08285 [Pseudaestuariivita atlantica]
MSRATPLIDWPLRAVLFPVLVAQALSVRRTAQILDEPPGPRSGGKKGGLRLLIIGDSSAAGIGCEHQEQALSHLLPAHLLPDIPTDWRLIAQTGARTGDVLDWLDTDPPGPVDIAVTALGVNDVTKLTTRGQWRDRQAALYDRLGQLGARRVYACGLPPVAHFPLLPEPLRWVLGRQAAAFDATLADLCRDHPLARHVPFEFDMVVEDMSPDGFHPGPGIYAGWARHLAGIIRSDRAAGRI